MNRQNVNGTTLSQIIDLIGILRLAYLDWGRGVSDQEWEKMPRAYHELLSDIPHEQLRAAALHHASRSKWFPKPSELREAAYDLANHGELSPTEAWEVVRAAMREFGVYRAPQIAHPLVAKAVAIMGWRDLCVSENVVADRAHFFRIYEAVLNRSRDATLMLPAVRDVMLRMADSMGLRLRLESGRTLLKAQPQVVSQLKSGDDYAKDR